MAETQEPLPAVDGETLEFNGDSAKPEWSTSGAVDLDAQAGPTHEERLNRLMQRGVIDPLLLLKLRLDVVTDFLVDPRFAPLLDQAYNKTLEEFLTAAEANSARQELLRK